MDIRQLNVLLAVADHGTFSAAADALHTVQSNVSTHIARLERELRTELVDRSTGALTAEGEAVASRARRIQGEVESIVPDLTAMHDEITGTVRIGMIGTVGRWLLPSLLKALAVEFPRIHLQIAGATTVNLAPHVADGSLQLALANLPIDDPDLRAEPLLDENRVLAVPCGSELALRSEISIADLADIDLIAAPAGTAFRDEIDNALGHHGLTLTPIAEVDSMGLVGSVVSSGVYSAVLPSSAVPADGTCVSIPIRGLPPRSVGLVSSRRVPPSATTITVVDVIRRIVADESARRPGFDLAVVAERTLT
jgi:DNA-binding transcriptional LysR family regulator